ncbi:MULTISPECIES: type II toxin-antitoxin system HipA family toxin [Variovorax]|uniref:type II toxin-antitoxin system HipA family toxin n=1 Tax=Variovorax TaxID=34072 RepID=UPI001F3B4FAB|nr:MULTISPECIES: type II toxin-antitoxin system HipA family toxin [Variovorax]UKI07798.1 type II toxin-antitoxin system HipA family toxin [Variovorax paradoxus]
MEVWLDSDLGALQQVGMLAHDRGRIRFHYTGSWLDDAHAFCLSPDLPLSEQLFFAPSEPGNFAVFRDICPDRWGLTLMEQWEWLQARDERRGPRELRAWDFMCGVQDLTRQGALRLRPAGAAQFIDAGAVPAPPAAELHNLAAAAQEIDLHQLLKTEASRRALTTLFIPGASLGGARPKVSFLDVDNGSLWIAKLSMLSDKRDVGAWEFLVHHLARRAGIEVPEAKLLSLGSGFGTFCIKRFDRSGGTRRLYASAMTLLGKKRGDNASYLEIAQFLKSQSIQHIGEDLAQLFRRVVFNVAVGNRDDHLRNHGFLRERNAWRLAPAFDVNPDVDKATHVLNLDHSDNRPNLDTVVGTAAFYGLTAATAAAVAAEVLDVVRGWKDEAAMLGIGRPEVRTTAPAFSALDGRVS